MNIFDSTIMEFINQFARHWYLFDKIVKAVAVNNLLKGGIFAAVIWWAWFRCKPGDSDKRDNLIATLIGSILAIGVARVLAMTLPFRFRPMHDPALSFIFPFGVSPLTLDGWSSFPSDHAALFFALATGLLFVSKRVGILSLLYATFAICLPRIYIGYHWPTDILAGMLIGVTIAVLFNVFLVKNKYLHWVVNQSYSQAMLFYPLLFLLTYQIADLFEGSRTVLSQVYELIKTVF